MAIEADFAVLRPIEPADDPWIAAIIRRVMTEYGASGPGFAIHDPEVDGIHAAYQRSGRAYFVIEQGRALLGGGGIAPLEGAPAREAKRICELRKMYFLPELRGRGLGQKLLDRCLDEARALGYRQCYLETCPGMREAIRLYERNRFSRLAAPLGGTGHFGCTAWYRRELE